MLLIKPKIISALKLIFAFIFLLISKKSIARIARHQKLVNHVAFSPNGHLFASASFDNSMKLWDGNTGKYVLLF